jgi:hypothetical protein
VETARGIQFDDLTVVLSQSELRIATWGAEDTLRTVSLLPTPTSTS